MPQFKFDQQGERRRIGGSRWPASCQPLCGCGRRKLWSASTCLSPASNLNLRESSRTAGGRDFVSQAAAILLIVQTVLAGISLFVLVDGAEWVRHHIRVIALWTVLIAGIVVMMLASRWPLANWAYGAFALVGVMGAA